MPQKGDLRVWWTPQVPMKPFHQDVKTVVEAKLVLKTLAQYDIFQFENRVKPDYTNAGGLEVFDGDEWGEWHSFNDDLEIDDYSLDALRGYQEHPDRQKELMGDYYRE